MQFGNYGLRTSKLVKSGINLEQNIKGHDRRIRRKKDDFTRKIRFVTTKAKWWAVAVMTLIPEQFSYSRWLLSTWEVKVALGNSVIRNLSTRGLSGPRYKNIKRQKEEEDRNELMEPTERWKMTKLQRNSDIMQKLERQIRRGWETRWSHKK